MTEKMDSYRGCYCMESFHPFAVKWFKDHRPDFIAYNHLWKKDFSYTLCRKLFKPENVAWTIKNQKELEEAEKTFDVIIFDSFIPKKRS